MQLLQAPEAFSSFLPLAHQSNPVNQDRFSIDQKLMVVMLSVFSGFSLKCSKLTLI